MRFYLFTFFTVLLLHFFSVANAQSDTEWEFQNVLPADRFIDRIHGMAFGGNGTVWAGPYFSLAPGNDLTPDDWINPVYCIDPATKELCEDMPFIIGTVTADTLLRFGPITGMASAPDGTVLISVHGYRLGPDGTSWNSSRAFVHRIDPETGEGLDVGEITVMRTETVSHSFHISADGSGNIYYSAVFPGKPIRVMDRDFQFIRNVSENRSGFARTIAANPAGTRVYQPTNYVTELSEDEEVGGRVEIHEGSVHTGFNVLDTMSIIGMDPGASFVCPITDVLYVPASGTGNDPEGDPERWSLYDIYGLQVTGPGNVNVVDQFTWNQRGSFNPIYRALAISDDGLSVVLGGFNHQARIQYFTRDAIPELAEPALPSVIKMEKSSSWVMRDSLLILNIYLGTEDNPVEDLHSVDFQVAQAVLNFEFEEIILGDFLAGDPQDLTLDKQISGSGLSVNVSVSRNKASGVSGYGKALSIVYRSVGPYEDTHAFTFDEVLALDSEAQPIHLAASGLQLRYSYATVWPGDTNNDGSVSSMDLLPIGIYYGEEFGGPNNPGSTWQARERWLWPADGNIPARIYADANGDGVVDARDVLSIGINYGRSRDDLAPGEILAMTGMQGAWAGEYQAESGTDVHGELFVEIIEDAFEQGRLRLAIDGGARDKHIYGLSLKLHFESDKTLLRSHELHKQSSKLGEELLVFSKQPERTSFIDIALSNTRGEGFAGSGRLLELDVKHQGEPGDEIAIHMKEVQAVSATGWPVVLKTDSLRYIIGQGVTTSQPDGNVPGIFRLFQNYPNPFNPVTQITYGLPEAEQVRLDIYDVLGRHVTTLVNARQDAGYHTVSFDAGRLSSGAYIYRLQAGSYVQTRSMLFIK